jgi:hypothetical protein
MITRPLTMSPAPRRHATPISTNMIAGIVGNTMVK